MDFFEHQEDAQRKTRWLLGYFALAVIGIILAVYAVVVVAVTPSQQLLDGRFSFWNPALLVWVALGALVFILGGSLYKISELAQGGRVVALSLGGQSLNPQTTDPDERRLLNVVEEMAIASGIPVPDVFVLRNEPGINAFAAGYSPSDAVIGVT
jgi:Zn-dependent protease with chaperone function